MFNAVAELEVELAPEERLLWSGQPKTGVRWRRIDLLLIPFGLVWLGFALFWEFKVVRLNDPMRIVLMLFGLPFVLTGFHLLGGRVLLDARKRRFTAYGITNQRVLIVSRGRSRRVRSVQLQALSEVKRVEHSDGSGDLRLVTAAGDSYAKVGREQRWSIPGGLVLEAVPRVREAEAALPRSRHQ